MMGTHKKMGKDMKPPKDNKEKSTLMGMKDRYKGSNLSKNNRDIHK